MYCTRKVTDDIVWVGGNDRRLSVFEGVYRCPTGVSYNSYLIKDRLMLPLTEIAPRRFSPAALMVTSSSALSVSVPE